MTMETISNTKHVKRSTTSTLIVEDVNAGAGSSPPEIVLVPLILKVELLLGWLYVVEEPSAKAEVRFDVVCTDAEDGVMLLVMVLESDAPTVVSDGKPVEVKTTIGCREVEVEVLFIDSAWESSLKAGGTGLACSNCSEEVVATTAGTLGVDNDAGKMIVKADVSVSRGTFEDIV